MTPELTCDVITENGNTFYLVVIKLIFFPKPKYPISFIIEEKLKISAF